MDESDVESICSSDFLPKPTPINAKHRRNHLLQSIDDRVDFERSSRKSTYGISNTGSQLSLNSSSSTESVDDELGILTSNLNLDDQHELKSQLLKRCEQTEVFPFDELYSAR